MAETTRNKEQKSPAENIELRSYELREILGQVPKWVVRYGTILILIVLLMLFAGSALLKYPDIITARVILTTETPPAELTAKTSAKIDKFLVADREKVAGGQMLAVFESAADYRDVIRLMEIVGESFRPDTFIMADLPDNLMLGPVQDAYAVFQKRIQNYKGFLRLDYHNRKILSVTAELNKYRLFMQRLSDQESVLKRDYELALRQYERDSMLFTDQVISSSQLERSEAQKLTKLNEWKNIQTKLASSQIEVSNLQQEILELELKLEDSSRELLQSLRESYEMLKGQIAIWKEQYLIYSPFDGQVSLTRIWSENQYVEKGEVVLTVLPLRQGAIIGKMLLSAEGAGKVKEGHRVIMRFDNYPYMEFGTVSGRIKSVSLVPTNDQYAAEVRLDSTLLVTNYGIELIFQQNMPGSTEIITDQKSLFERIIDPFRSALGRQRTLRE
jgi:multidrug efflux pump subunit AcrA (membrane-fusion protein)